MKWNLLVFLLFVLAFPLLSQVDSTDSVNVDTSYYYDDEYYDDEYIEEDIEEDTSGYLGEINFVMDMPDGQMKKKFNKIFYGFDLGLYKQLNKTVPMFVGGGFSYKGYDSESISYFDYSEEDGQEYEFSEDFKGNLFDIYIGAKYFSTKSFWIFNPYFQIDLEYRRAYISITETNLDLDETVNTDFRGGNSSFGYNIGVGSIMAVNSDKYYINLRVSYSSGGGLFLYKRNKETSAVYVTDYFDKKYFPIGLITLKLGVTFL